MTRRYRIQYQTPLGYLESLVVRASSMHEATQQFITELHMHTLYTEQEREQCRIIQITELGESEE